MPDSTELRQALREYEEAATHVEHEIEQIEAGTADGALQSMLNDPVPQRFAQVQQRSGKSFPDAPEISTEALCDARARNIAALESSLIRVHGAFGLGANADAGGGRRAARQAGPLCRREAPLLPRTAAAAHGQRTATGVHGHWGARPLVCTATGATGAHAALRTPSAGRRRW